MYSLHLKKVNGGKGKENIKITRYRHRGNKGNKIQLRLKYELTWRKHLNLPSSFPEILKLPTLYKTLCIIRHFLNTFCFFNVFLFHSKNGTVECWPLNQGMLDSQWNGPVMEILEVRLGRQSCVRAGNAQGRGGGVGMAQPMRQWGGGAGLWEVGNTFMRTSLFLLLANRLHGSSLH